MFGLIFTYLVFLYFGLLVGWSTKTKKQGILRFNILIVYSIFISIVSSYYVIKYYSVLGEALFSFVLLVLGFSYSPIGLYKQKKALKKQDEYFIRTLKSGEFSLQMDTSLIPTSSYRRTEIEYNFLVFDDIGLYINPAKMNFTEKDSIEVGYSYNGSKYVLEYVEVISKKKTNISKRIDQILVFGSLLTIPIYIYINNFDLHNDRVFGIIVTIFFLGSIRLMFTYERKSKDKWSPKRIIVGFLVIIYYFILISTVFFILLELLIPSFEFF